MIVNNPIIMQFFYCTLSGVWQWKTEQKENIKHKFNYKMNFLTKLL